MLEGHAASSRDAPEYHHALLFAFCFAESKIPLLFWWFIATSAGWWNRLNCQEIYNTRSFWLPLLLSYFDAFVLSQRALMHLITLSPFCALESRSAFGTA
jgi:hypothetical protein